MRQNLWPNALAKLCGAALKQIICMVIIALLSLTLAGCVSGETEHDPYSSTYHSDSQYRSNVDKIASEWGTSSAEVDRKITAITDALK